MRLNFRFSVAFLLAAVSGAASAIGLGDLRGQPSLGDRFSLAVNLLGVEKSLPDASCFRLVRPSQGDSLAWLRDAELRVVAGHQPVLEIRSARVLREPLMQLAIHVACGYDVQREYTLLASPRGDLPTEATISDASLAAANRAAPQGVQKQWAGGSSASLAKAPKKAPVPASVVSTESAIKSDPADRLMLSGASDSELSLRLEKLFEQQLKAGEQDEKRRELLRQEFRLLMAMQEKAGGDVQTIEKLRNMEAALLELRQDFQGLSDAAVPASPLPPSTEVSANPPADVSPQMLPQVRPDAQAAVPVEESSVSDWMLYGLLIGVVLGVAGWLLWGAYRDQTARRLLAEDAPVNPRSVVNLPPLDDLREGSEGGRPPLVSPFEPSSAAPSAVIATARDEEAVPSFASAQSSLQAGSDDVSSSVSGQVPDGHPDVSPVMELADIMLSFGRVKGAAQALQEYVDNNPQEALQPWIRLMDVYRMAGMREEFERVARNLNQNFNVEIQSWDAVRAAAAVDLVVAPESGTTIGEPDVVSTALSLEEMPGIISSIVRMWGGEDVVGYLYQLLRDNRGGLRQGFPMPVVEEILFLIELKETANRMGEESIRRT